MLIRAAALGSSVADIRLAEGKIAAIAPHILPRTGEEIVEATGRALLPGLHDHHIHLMSLAAALDSVFCGPPQVTNEAALFTRLRAQSGTGWLRGIGYHESVAGELTRAWLDRALPDRPARIQHRSGRLWIFNSAALELLDEEGAPFDRATGHLYDGDDWLRTRLRSAPPDLARAGALLASYGVTGVTDTSFRNGPEQFELLRAAHDIGALPQDLRIMGMQKLDVRESPGVTRGEVKFHLHDHDHPAPDTLRDAFRAAHDSGRAVAIHCVTLADLVLTLNALEDAGARPGDRIEHASICPPDFYPHIRALGVTIVTQPNFVTERGDAYLSDVADTERNWLYPCATLIEAGIKVACGTDAPYGDCNPWAAMQSATTRRTASGKLLSEHEIVSPETALALFLGAPNAPASPRKIEPGAPADLCLLDRDWNKARENLGDVKLLLTLKDGMPIYRAQEMSSSIKPHSSAIRAGMRRAESAI